MSLCEEPTSAGDRRVESGRCGISVDCLDKKSERIFALREHALVGISPFNGYFSEERMERLFSWAFSNFKSVSVFIPDEISKYTLRAAGYSEDKASRKTKRQDRYLKSKALRALMANKLSKTDAESKIVCLSELSTVDRYAECYNNCVELYEKDENFKKGCLETSKWVLEGKGVRIAESDESASVAAKYFLAELPMYLDTPGALGVSSSSFVYKDSPPNFLKTIYADNSLVSKTQGYLTVKAADGERRNVCV